MNGATEPFWLLQAQEEETAAIALGLRFVQNLADALFVMKDENTSTARSAKMDTKKGKKKKQQPKNNNQNLNTNGQFKGQGAYLPSDFWNVGVQGRLQANAESLSRAYGMTKPRNT